MNVLINLPKAQLLGIDNSHLCWVSDKIGIHKDMLNAYRKMQTAAKKVHIDLHIASGWRGFDRQLQLWNNKFLGKTPIKDLSNNIININHVSELDKIYAILVYSALPGASRHHWGTDIDVFAPNLLAKNTQLQLEPWEYEKNGPLSKLSQWLEQFSQEFGFYFPYDSYRGGIAHEPWHLSYAPLAEHYQQQFSIASLVAVLEESDIEGKKIIINHIDEIYQKFIVNINKR
ncbi:MAG: M15 family metallopeptidase [Colwellia sp.]|nr:M15 family metallopeptidase [Colwellia sp.]